MATSDITVAALTAIPTLRGNKCAWIYSDPRSNALPNIGLDMVEVWASTTNDRAAAAKVGEGIIDFTHSGLIEETTYYYWIKARDYLGGYGAWFPSGSTAGISATAISASAQVFVLANAKIIVNTHSTDATVATNSLRIDIKTAAGNDPSITDAIFVAFSNPTVNAGNYQTRQLSSAISLTLSSGSTLGYAGGGSPIRLWLVLFDDGGTARLGIINCSDSGTVYPLSLEGIRSSVAEGGAGAADNFGIIYTTIAVTSKSYRIIGILEWSSGFSSGGVWNTMPDVIKLASVNSFKPGDIIQEQASVNPTKSTGTTITPFDNTPPQITEGNASGMTAQTFVPFSACDIIEFDIFIHVSHTVAATYITGALFLNGGTNAIAACCAQVALADGIAILHFKYRVRIGNSSSRTYDFRVGGSVAGTLTQNGYSPSNLFNSIMTSYYKIIEIVG